jgi:hypothetical protein
MNKIILRLSNELGNQMFMYASALGISKKINRKLLIDNETAFLLKKNISKYGLNNFNIKSEIAPDDFKFLGTTGYLKRKLFIKSNFFISKKRFLIEKKNEKKISSFDDKIFDIKFSKNIFMEGNFESEKYFSDIKHLIVDEFRFNYIEKYQKSPFFKILNDNNAVSICLRQNRFLEGKKNKNNDFNKMKSKKFSNEQINYINKSINFFNNKINNPIFYIWSNDFYDFDESKFNSPINKVIHNPEFLQDIDKRALDLFLISLCKNHIVIPSSFNWWGAWLSSHSDKITLRPSENFFSAFEVNNRDFWPSDWIEINP